MRISFLLLFAATLWLTSCYTTSNTTRTRGKGVSQGEPELVRFDRHVVVVEDAPDCRAPRLGLSVQAINLYEETKEYPTYRVKQRTGLGDDVSNYSLRGAGLGALIGGYLILADNATAEQRRLGTYILGGAGGLGLIWFSTRKASKEVSGEPATKQVRSEGRESMTRGQLELSYASPRGRTVRKTYDLADFRDGQVELRLDELGIDFYSYEQARYVISARYEGKAIGNLTVQGPINAALRAECIMRTMDEAFNFQFARGVRDAIANDLVATLSDCTLSATDTNSTVRRSLITLLKRYGFADTNARAYANKIVADARC